MSEGFSGVEKGGLYQYRVNRGYKSERKFHFVVLDVLEDTETHTRITAYVEDRIQQMNFHSESFPFFKYVEKIA